MSFSKPKGPAMPQQPESRSSTSAPVRRRRAISSCMPMVARWWQWPWTMIFSFELRGLVVGGVLDEELAEEEGLVAELGGAGVVGEEVGELVAEDGGAAGFEDDDGCAGVSWGVRASRILRR